MHSFSETDKLNYAGIEDDGMFVSSYFSDLSHSFRLTDNMFHFTCFNVEDPHDPTVGLFNGQLSIPGNLLRREVFDPVVNQVVQLLEEQVSRVEQPIHALLLVGGFAGSEYLKQRVEVSGFTVLAPTRTKLNMHTGPIQEPHPHHCSSTRCRHCNSPWSCPVRFGKEEPRFDHHLS